MKLFEFTVHLDRCPDDAGLDRIFEAGLDDTQPVRTPHGRARLMVCRESDTLAQALVSVVADIERAGFQATGIDAEDLVTYEVIAQRTGRTRESVRLLAVGKRGPGGFPAPVGSAKPPFFSWVAVREWFRDHYGDKVVGEADHDADILVAADLLLRARLVAPGDMRALSPLVAA